jgi:hypothetical protein
MNRPNEPYLLQQMKYRAFRRSLKNQYLIPMKHFSRLLTLLLLIGAGAFLSNCGSGGGDEPSVEETQLNLLKGTWTVSGATFNNTTTRQAEFVGGTLTITDNKVFNFSKTGGISASPWPSSVSWDFGADPKTQITRNDADGAVTLTYEVSASSLKITMANYAGASYDVAGRVESTDGNWVFTFTK